MLKYWILLFLMPLVFYTQAQTVTGELKKWHTITIEFTDDASYTETGNPNPFLDRRLDVTFVGPNEQIYVVPGYFAADGNAAETSASNGNKWHVKFSPDEMGQWNYTASFREGTGVAVTYPSSPTDGVAGFINGQGGNFTIASSDKTGKDFRGKGRLQYDGTRYPKFAETGEAFIKAGPDSPENFLAFNDFDAVYVYGGTNYIKNYSNHVADWQTGDPVWQATKGKGIIGAINYLSSVGMNSISFLTMNKSDGDTKDVTMHVDQSGQQLTDFTRFDVSRIAQWEIVFQHAQEKGMFLHFKTQEQENAAQLNSGSLGTERKLYYREIIARFGHHLVLNWNMGEENEGSSAKGLVNTTQRITQLSYVKDIDPYDHIRVVHSAGSSSGQDALYNPLLGSQSELTGMSMQVLFQNNHDRVKYWVDQSANAGKQWVISSDETGTGGIDNQANRENKLYGTYFAGGYGVEYYFQGQDFTIQNFRSGDKQGIWEKTKYALDFMNMIPFTEMEGDDSLISGSGNQCFYKNNDTYAVYLPNASDNPTLDINNTGDTYTIKWYDVRNGGSLQNGTIASITSNGTAPNIGLPPNSTTSDWVALVTDNSGGSSPGLSINNITITEGNNVVFTVRLTNSAGGSFSVDFATSNDSATAGSDYTANTGTLNFNGTSGETRTVTVATTDDASVESTERFFLDLSNATNGVTIEDSQGTATITDNDTAANISINDVVVEEGEDVVFTVTLDNAVTGGFSVDFATADLSATSGEDYTSSSGTVTFNGTAGETQNITIATIDDAMVENSEQFVVSLGTVAGVAVTDDQGLATLTDNDITANISIGNVSVNEGNNAVFTVSLDNAVTGGFSVDYATADNTANAGSDYSTNTGTLNFNGTAGETRTVTVATTDDAIVESNERFFLNLSNANIAEAQGIATITDNDAAANISIGNVSVNEGNNAVFTVSLDNAVTGGFSVDFATADNTANAGSDYSTNTGTLNFNGTAGETRTVTVATTDDAIVESNERFFLNLSNATNGANIAEAQGIATITDNDATANISIGNVSVSEGNNAVFTVSLDNAVTGGFSVDYATADDTASAGQDYSTNTGTLNFTGTAGETQTITVATIDDAVVESNEQFLVNLSNASNAVNIADAQGIATINDNDSLNNLPGISIENATAEEGEILRFILTLDQQAEEEITFSYEFINNTADEKDYEGNPSQIIVPAGQTSVGIEVPILTDTEIEDDETFTIQIVSIEEGAITNSGETAVGTIVDKVASEEIDILLYPVPLTSGDELTIGNIEDGEFFLAVYSISGHLLLSKRIDVSGNSYSFDMNNNSATGFFLLTLNNPITGASYQKKFVIAR